MIAAVVPAARAGTPPPATAPSDGERRAVRDGVAIDFTLTRSGEPGPVREGDLAEVRFRMTDVSTGRPVPGLKPAAWMDMAGVVAGKPGQDRACKDKVSLYL